MSRAAFAGLGLSAAALAGIVAIELSQIKGDQIASTAAAAAVARWSPAPVVPIPTAPDRSREWGATALERPLFAADRRPVSEQRPTAMAGGRDLPRLTGVLVGPTGRTAIFAAAAEGARPIVLREGDSLGAFEVKTILVGQVMLIGPEGEHVLRPSFDSRSGGGTTARPAAFAPGRPAVQVTTAAGAGTNDVPGFIPAATPSGTSAHLPPDFPPRDPAR